MIGAIIKSNFKFKSLLNYVKSNKWEHYITAITSKPIAENAKKNIFDGKLTPPLKNSTISIRRERGIGGSKPLFATGALYNSIKATRGGVQMLEYGTLHNKRGFKPKYIPIVARGEIRYFKNKKNIRVPVRNFLSVDVQKKPEIENKIAKKFNEKLKLK